MSLSPTQLTALRDCLRPDQLLLDPAECLCYGYDNSKQQATPDAVALPQDTAQVVALLRACSAAAIPVVTRGAGTNTVGATVPITGGLVLSLEQMNRLLELSAANRYLRCEAGMRNGEVQQHAASAAMFWPPDPTSAAFSTVGGNLGCNAGGPRAVKYGTCRENTLGLTAVTGDGRLIHTGSKTTKGVVGYDLSRLLIGSEGTLAVITEATLLLQALPPERWSLRAAYRDVASATAAVSALMAQAARPCALEFMDGTAVKLVMAHGGIDLPADTGALLLMEIDGQGEQMEIDAEAMRQVGERAGCLDWRIARDPQSSQSLWQARKALSPCLRKLAPKKLNEDVVVPVSRLPELIGRLEAISQRHGLPIVNFGHAGNGNVHVNILADPTRPGQMEARSACLDEVFETVLALDGTLSGEHGVGLAKRDYIARELGETSLQLMRELKRVFDPAGILNPGKSLPPPRSI